MKPPVVPIEELRPLKCLSRFTDEERLRFVGFTEAASCARDTVLFEEGDHGDCMYLILAGQMRVFRRKKGGQIEPLKVLGPGDAFGDIALFHGTPRTASVDALDNTRMLKLTAAGLEKLTAQEPAMSADFLHSLATALTQMYRDFH
jgi:CRP-like cAMP-binding protein